MSQWIRVEDRLPPACQKIWVYRQNRPGASRTVEVYFVNTHPRECVEDDRITHWQPLLRPEKP